MFAEERQERILDILQKKQRVLAKTLADQFEVSIDSIRRDLSLMEEHGLLKRTHGGAISISKVRKPPLVPALRYNEGTRHQQAVSKLAVSEIERGDTVFIGGASIHYVMLKYLPTDMPITVVTNSIIIADPLLKRQNVETFMVCGKLKSSGSITDALATTFIRNLKLDKAFLVGAGLTAEHGVSMATPDGAVFHRTVAESARKTICLSNYNKIGTEAFTRVVPVSDIDLIITDWEAPLEEINKLEKQGLKVLIAQENK